MSLHYRPLFGSQGTGQRYHSKSQTYHPISISKALAKSIWRTNSLMLGKGCHGYQHVQNTPVKLQYAHSLQHHQGSTVLFMAKFTTRNREHSLTCTTWCNDETMGQLLPITQHGHKELLMSHWCHWVKTKPQKCLPRQLFYRGVSKHQLILCPKGKRSQLFLRKHNLLFPSPGSVRVSMHLKP